MEQNKHDFVEEPEIKLVQSKGNNDTQGNIQSEKMILETITTKDSNGNIICEEAVKIKFLEKELMLSLIMEPDDLMPLFDGCGWAGTMVWQGSVVVAEYLAAEYAESLRGASVVELGCGCGLPGMIARFLGAEPVILTEQEGLLPLLHRNLQANFPGDTEIQAEELDWSSQNALEFKESHKPTDFLICCDCIYEPLYGESWKELSDTIYHLQCSNTKIILSAERRTADGVEKFLQRMAEDYGLTSKCILKSRTVIELYEFSVISHGSASIENNITDTFI